MLKELTNIYDYNSTYYNNYALNGGVIACQQC
jgi:hypothetical protein